MEKHQRVQPAPGQESVWDYPRPPAIERVNRRIVVRFGNRVIADTRRAIKCMETSHPPSYYIPQEDVHLEFLSESNKTSVCEWKGGARYHHARVGEREELDAAWSYPTPRKGFEMIAGCVSFYPGKMDECTVDGEKVRPQPGAFYGGWITDEIVGPFKGGPGSVGW